MAHTPSLTRYSGFPGGVSIAGIPILSTYSRSVWWVDSVNGADGHKGTRQRPWKTLAYAATVMASQSGTQHYQDIIMVAAGHTETLSSATALAMSVPGIQVIGLGSGDSRPTFTLDTIASATIAVSAANVRFQNCVFVANILSCVSCFTLTTAKGFALVDCEFRDASSITNFLNIVNSTGIANTIDGISCIGNKWAGLGTTSVSTFLLSANDIDRATVCDNTIVNATTVDKASLIIVTAGVLTNLYCADNKTYRNNTTSTVSLISVGGTTSTGFVVRNYTQTLDTATNALFTTSVGLAPFENYITGVKGASGFIIPARDS